MIEFRNAGEIDLLGLTTMGLSAKVGDNPIGKFGTGLKYAIATLLRTGHRVTLLAGEDIVRFSTRKIESRGKDFELVEMRVGDDPHRSLGITTELGSSWQVWMAYRELYCNCKDEGGGVTDSYVRAAPERNTTTFIVEGEEFETVHRDWRDYFLDESVLADVVLPGVRVFKKPSKIVFYRGMRVLELPKPAAMTYDFTRSLTLTEDRTLAHPFMLQYYLAEEMGKCEDEAVVMAALRAASDSLESQIDWTSVSPTRTVIGAIGIIDRSAPGLLPIGARALMRVASRVDFVPELVTITGEQSDVLAEVQCRLQRTIGGDSASILLVRDTAIESGVMEHEGQVLMTLEAFDRWVGNKKEDREANDTTSRDVLRAAIEATGKSLERDDLLDLLVMCGRVWP